MEAEKILQEIVAKPHTPQISALLAEVLYRLGAPHSEADRIAMEIEPSTSDTPMSSDQEIEYHYLRGMRALNGWGIDKNEDRAIADLQLAARRGHPQAKNVLITLKKTW
ncbi:MAG: hypothetical protein Q4A74_05515 [Cardiobacteriaceae bacterium]|nr:hypothetical protein [Cardiobacteriaceae bacterium]